MDKWVIRNNKPASTSNEGRPGVVQNEETEVDVRAEDPQPVQYKEKSQRRFRDKWLTSYSWLNIDNGKAFCKVCQSCESRKLLTFSTKKEKAFLSEGFTNFKKGPEKFRAHEKSRCHWEAVSKYASYERGTNVVQTLPDQKGKEMVQARDALLSVISSLWLLARQGMAIRGHEDFDSNFMQLVMLRAGDNEALAGWMKRKDKFKFLSHDIQNEIIKMLAFEVLRQVIVDVKEAKLFSVIVDETSDITQREQMSICVR